MNKPRIMVACHALIECDGKFLVTKRSSDNDYMSNRWDIPGGSVENGELAEQTIIREVFEETGLVLGMEEYTLLGVYTNLDSLPKSQHYSIIYYARMEGNLPRIQIDEEHSEYKWENMIEIFKMDTLKLVRYSLNILLESKLSKDKVG